MSEWIKVSDRLPEEEGGYLVAFKDEKFVGFKGPGNELIWYVTEATYYPDNDRWYTGGEINALITHWMPFPDPPEDNQC